MTFQLTREPDGWRCEASTLDDAQQFAQGVAVGPLRWSARGGDSWEATDPETGELYLIGLELALA